MKKPANESRVPYVKPKGATKEEAVNLRKHSISVRVNSEELAWVKQASKSARLMMGTYLRVAAFGQHRAQVSELNQKGLLLLAESTESVLRIADSLEGMELDKSDCQREFTLVIAEMQRVRQLLVGALAPGAVQTAQ